MCQSVLTARELARHTYYYRCESFKREKSKTSWVAKCVEAYRHHTVTVPVNIPTHNI